MMNRLKIIATAMMLMCVGTVTAQNSFNIPYSQYGMGESNTPFNAPFAASMGGVAYTQSGSNFVNPFNPASYADVEKESFVFDMGFYIQMSKLNNGTSTLVQSDGNIGYLTVAFPLTQWWKTSIGLLPHTSMNYASTLVDSVPGSNLKTIYDGDGGLNQVYWGHAVNIGKRLSIGANIDYTFGTVQREIVYDFQGSDTTYWVDSFRQKRSTVRSLFFDLGLNYRQPIGEKYTMHLGLVCKLPRTASVSDEGIVATALGDTIFPLPGTSSKYTSTLERPMSIGVGLAFERNDKWQVAMDFTHSPWSGFKYTENTEYNLFGRSSLAYGDDTRLSLGVEMKGNMGATRYINRIGVRFGAHYEQGKLLLNLDNQEKRLDEVGFGAGISMPMRKGKSVLNLSLNYAHYGALEPLLRNTLTFGISVGSCESWFVKRKYN